MAVAVVVVALEIDWFVFARHFFVVELKKEMLEACLKPFKQGGNRRVARTAVILIDPRSIPDFLSRE